MSAGRVIGDYQFIKIDVSGLSAELVATIDAHQRVMMKMTAAEWAQWMGLDMQGRSDWLDARSKGALS